MLIKDPIHPGQLVRHECMEPLGLTVTEVAKRLGVSRKQLSGVLNGHTRITPKMAIRLDKAFGGGAATWCRMQAVYDLAQALKEADDIRVERIAPPTAPELTLAAINGKPALS